MRSSSRSRLLASTLAAIVLTGGGAALAQAQSPSGADPATPRAVPAPSQGSPHGIHGPASAHGHPHHARAEHRRGDHDGGGHGGAMMGKGLLRGLNLSEAQRDRVFTIMHSQAPVMREQAKQVRQARQDLQALALAGELDDSRLRAAADRVSRAMADMAVLRARTHHEVFKVLTPEQQSQLRARLAERQHHGHGSHRG